MKIIEVNKVEQILLAKQEMEILNPDKPKQDLQSFINGLNMKDTIFVKDDIVIPFSIINDSIYVVSEDNQLNILIERLKTFEYDLSRLTEVPVMEVYNGKLEKYDFYFIINSKYMVLEK
jgi:hypothetical protein